MAILANAPQSDGVVLISSVTAKAFLAAGKPLGEAVVQYGPFVMKAGE